jgi:metal-sulfur cluster biosynthetic enzyme
MDGREFDRRKCSVFQNLPGDPISPRAVERPMGSDEVSITRAGGGGFPSPAAVRRALQTVLDPELDQSLLELGLGDDISVQEGHVTVVMRLPTTWCASAFVYLMASDIRAALLALPGLTGITVRLPGYVAASAIEVTVGRGGTFADVSPGEGSGRVEDLRRAFLRKGVLARQARILDAWPRPASRTARSAG